MDVDNKPTKLDYRPAANGGSINRIQAVVSQEPKAIGEATRVHRNILRSSTPLASMAIAVPEVGRCACPWHGLHASPPSAEVQRRNTFSARGKTPFTSKMIPPGLSSRPTLTLASSPTNSE